MKVFLAGTSTYDMGLYEENGGGIPKDEKPFILESFYYIKEPIASMIHNYGDFLLDSGAFTFMENSKKSVNWEEYIEQYADFVNKYDVEKFFELDIDPLVGYENVLKYREKLESLTGKKSIPVWHSNRGKEEFLKTCEEYDYVAVGGIVGKEWKADKYIPWFITEAHKRGAKIHGLGYTKLTKLPYAHFDSVDSTSWLSGNRYGGMYCFKNGSLKRIDTSGYKNTDGRRLAKINFQEWLKFSKWAEYNL